MNRAGRHRASLPADTAGGPLPGEDIEARLLGQRSWMGRADQAGRRGMMGADAADIVDADTAGNVGDDTADIVGDDTADNVGDDTAGKRLAKPEETCP